MVLLVPFDERKLVLHCIHNSVTVVAVHTFCASWYSASFVYPRTDTDAGREPLIARLWCMKDSDMC